MQSRAWLILQSYNAALSLWQVLLGLSTLRTLQSETRGLLSREVRRSNWPDWHPPDVDFQLTTVTAVTTAFELIQEVALCLKCTGSGIPRALRFQSNCALRSRLCHWRSLWLSVSEHERADQRHQDLVLRACSVSKKLCMVSSCHDGSARLRQAQVHESPCFGPPAAAAAAPKTRSQQIR